MTAPASDSSMSNDQINLLQSALSMLEETSKNRIQDLEGQVATLTESLELKRLEYNQLLNDRIAVAPCASISPNTEIIEAFRGKQFQQTQLTTHVIKQAALLLTSHPITDEMNELLGNISELDRIIKDENPGPVNAMWSMPEADTFVAEVRQDSARVDYKAFSQLTEAHRWQTQRYHAGAGNEVSTYPLYKLHSTEIITQLWSELQKYQSTHLRADERLGFLINTLEGVRTLHKLSHSENLQPA